MTSERTQSETGRLLGGLLLALGLLGSGVLVASGLHALAFDQPDMVHFNHALTTVIGGPLAVGLVAAGLILRRRS